MTMLTKFESKSNRVKGLSFHISRPWLLSSLHNGVIQLWDYRMGTLLDRFEEHDGPVRGIDFHHSQPLFVSGGDDYKIKVWDYKLRRCLFTLMGHLDYIRTVEFHNEYPWIVSCSDDQTVRIWNWQSRSCVSVLTGHNHYVMCAAFHPKDDLIVSASLDQTIRVWDTTGLRKKTVRGAPPSLDQMNMGRSGPGSSSRSNDLFSQNDAIVKYVLEGHDRGVNYVGFHPNLPLIVSGADDRQIKLWRMNDTKAWEVDTLRGHTNNVSSVLFHPRHELIISNSEDRSIRVWDVSKRMGIQTFRRENDRFWIMAAHPKQNLLAAGHDSGMIVFKLERERPALESLGGKVYYVKERYLRVLEFSTGRDIPVATLRRSGVIGAGQANQSKMLNYNSYNTSENNVLISSDSDGGSYELITFSKEESGQNDAQDIQKGIAMVAVFVSRNRFAVLDKNRQLIIKNFSNEVVKKIVPPHGGADGLFFAGTVGRVLIKVDEKIILYETQSHRELAEIQAPRVKYVYWSNDFSHVALVSKHNVIIADRQLKLLSTITETVRIKSGIWDFDSSGIFVYTTLNHIKYALTNGDTGIIRTLNVPVYLTALLNGSELHCLDREGKARTISVDLTECHFKIALSQKRYKDVMRMVKHSRLCGRAIVSYLTNKGYPEVALHFVDDETTRFNLAISCGNLEVALNSAYELDQKECWHQLGVAALRQGNIQVVEMAYQKTKDFDRLSFLYLLTGNRDKLKKMMKIAEMRNDVMSWFHNALYLGDISERINILESVGQLSLAYITAVKHGLTEESQRLHDVMTESEQTIPDINADGILMMPPIPIRTNQSDENWPLVESTEPTLEESARLAEAEMNNQTNHEEPHDQNDQFDDFHDSSDSFGNVPRKQSDIVDTGAEWDDDMDLDLEEDDDLNLAIQESKESAEGIINNEDGFVAAPTEGVSPNINWPNNSSVASDHVAAGSFDTAMQLLHRQIGIVNFAPLKPMFLSIYRGSTGHLSTIGSFPALSSYLQRSGHGTKQSLPLSSISLTQLTNILKKGYRAFTAAHFDEVKEHFEYIIHSIPLLSVETLEEVNRAKEMLSISREYLIAYSIRQTTNEVTFESNPCRNVELSAYFTHCNLQPSHLLLTLKIAMTSAFKSKNYIAAASFCRRLLELPDISTEKNSKLKMMARKVLQKSEKEARNAHELNYNEKKIFNLCGKSLTPLYKDTMESYTCPYCNTFYKAEYKGTLCTICGLSKIGEETIGLVVSAGTN